MNKELVQQLNAINREFYSRFADAFSRSRTLAQPSLCRLLAYVPAAARAFWTWDAVTAGLAIYWPRNGRVVITLDWTRVLR